MKSTRSCLGRVTLASLLLGPASVFAADQTISGNLTVTGDADVAGALGVMGNIETDGSVRAVGPIISGGIESWSILAQGGIYTVGRKVVFKGVTHGTSAYSTLAGRGLALLVINRASLSVVSHINYDCYGSETEREAMATALNALGDDKFVVITSGDAWRTNANLKAALLRVGASPAAVEADGNLSYALVGIPGVGAGNGIEALNEVGNATPLASVGAQFIRPAADTNSAYELGGRKDSTFIKNDGTFQFAKPVSVNGGLTVNGSPVLTSDGGSGANLTGLNAANISTGTLDASLLPSSAVQLTANQTLSSKTLVGAVLTGNTTLGGATTAQQAAFTSNGFLGININPPADYIHIKTSALQRDGGITLQTYTDNQAEIRFQDSAGTYRWALGLQDGPTKDFRIANSAALHVAPALTINNATQNVGLGTTTPSSRLDVMGGSNSQYGGRNILGDDGNFNPFFKQYRWSGVDASQYSSRQILSGDGGGAALLRFQIGSSLAPIGSETFIDALSIKGNGNVGIGTNSPATKLDVAGSVRVTGSSPFVTLTGSGNYSGGFDIESSAAGGRKFRMQSSGPSDSAGAGKFLIQDGSASFSTRLAIDSAGNVGINTSAPSEKLDVVGNIKLTGNIITPNGTIVMPLNAGTLLSTTGSQTITGATTIAGSVTLGGSIVTQQVKVDGVSGNVGIGTGPSYKLHVSGGTLAVDSGSGTDTLRIRDGAITKTAGTGFAFTSSLLVANGADYAPGYTFYADPNTGIYATGSDVMGFATGGASRVVIDSVGNVGVGTITPQALLHVQAPASIDGGKALRVVDSGFPATPANSSSPAVGQVQFSPVVNNAAVVSLGRRSVGATSSGMELGTVLFNGSGTDGASFRKGAAITAVAKTNNWGNSSAPTDLAISVNSGTAQVEQMTEVVRISKDTVTINGGVAVNGLVTKLRVARQGDIDMGEFTASPAP